MSSSYSRCSIAISATRGSVQRRYPQGQCCKRSSCTSIARLRHLGPVEGYYRSDRFTYPDCVAKPVNCFLVLLSYDRPLPCHSFCRRDGVQFALRKSCDSVPESVHADILYLNPGRELGPDRVNRESAASSSQNRSGCPEYSSFSRLRQQQRQHPSSFHWYSERGHG